MDELRNSAMRMSYQLFSTVQNELVATAEAVIVCVDQENMQKAAIPEDIREKILKIWFYHLNELHEALFPS